MDMRSAWLLPFGLLAFVVVFVPLRILDDEGLPRYRVLRAELRRVQDENDRLRGDLWHLEREVTALRSDPESLERIARDELGMLGPGEILFQFDE